MRRTLICAVALLVLGACHGGGGGARTTLTYVNEKNETLTMEYQPAVYDHLYNVTHKDMKLYGGTYTLKTSEGTSSGMYTRSVSGNKVSLVFQPEEGKEWGVDVAPDDSFKTEHGIWRKPRARVEVMPPALVKVGP